MVAVQYPNSVGRSVYFARIAEWLCTHECELSSRSVVRFSTRLAWNLVDDMDRLYKSLLAAAD